MKTHTVDVQLRFNDTDALGHVNNSSFAHYAEVGRIEFLKATGAKASTAILAHIELDFRAQVLFGANVQVETMLEQLGNSSLSMVQRILADGELACDVKSVVVNFDYKTNKPTRISDEARKKLEPYLLEPAQ